MRKIAMISDHASPIADLGSVDSGGQNVYVAQVARHLAGMGYEVDVFTRKDSDQYPEIYDWQPGVRIIYVPAGPAQFIPKEELFPYMADFTSFMIDFFQKQETPYDIIHAHFWMSAMVAADIKKALGIPFVVTFHALGRVRRLHQGKDDGFPDIRFDIEDRVVAEADRIIAECPQDQDDLLNLYQAELQNLVIIPCGFDPVELWPMDKALSRMVLGIPAEDRVVLQLGRMVPRKGVDTAIRGFSRMIKKYHLPARLLIVGGESEEPNPENTPEIARLKVIAAEEGVLKKVVFTGRRDRQALKYYYSAADVFISTPWYEPFGITPVEAMACGTPVIGSNVGGIKYTVREGETGFLVSPNDPVMLSERLAYLFSNPDELKRMSRQAVKRANDLFTWIKISETIVNLYETVIAEKSSAGAIMVQQNYEALIDRGFESAIQVLQLSQKSLPVPIMEAARRILDVLEKGNKVMVCGNGGSATDAQHFAAELVGRFITPSRKALPVMALTADTAFLTAWSNDIGYDQVFSRQVEAYGDSGDLLIGISTSGCSQNLIEAFKTAQQMGLSSLALIGGDGGNLITLADHAIVVPSTNTQRIQEIQILLLHLICEIVEGQLSPVQIDQVQEQPAWGMSQPVIANLTD
ncbi:MAG: glycosyltransferase [Omnitrophica WOR_2 bacterium]